MFFKDLHEQKHCFFLQTSKSLYVADTVSCLQIADLPFFGVFQFFKTAGEKRKKIHLSTLLSFTYQRRSEKKI